MTTRAATVELYVATNGNDGWSGRSAEPNADGTDGPLATLEAAQKAARQLRDTGALTGGVRVLLRGGRYALDEPLMFTPVDSAPVTYASYPGEEAILDGGRRIDGWTEGEVNGKAAWVAEVPEVAAGKWYFRQLFVNGERRPRARLPKDGEYTMEDVVGRELRSGWGKGGDTCFRAAEGDFGSWQNVADIEVVVLHWWIEERFPVVSFDAETRLVELGRTSRAPLVDDRCQHYARYYLDNVLEALTEPGEWYLDRAAGKLYYLPREGETPEDTEVFAPRLLQLLKLVGRPEDNQYVEFVRFENLTFEHTRWTHPGDVDDDSDTYLSEAGLKQRSVKRYHRGNDAAASQAACDVPGVIYLEGARYCALENCRVRHAGWYGVELADGCIGNRIVGNEIHDLGAGGVKMNGAAAGEPYCRRTGNNRLTDNHIHAGGRVFHSGIGVLSMHAFGNRICHNHIHDFYYSGVSCGWVWGYAESVSRDNLIEKNHIHDLGQGLLSDMGGIYTLGVQPGTVLRGNLIHDVTKRNYGGWCIYPDEGSSHILIEHNICYDTNNQIFHQHYGRENTVRNNIFAFGGESISAHGRVDAQHKGFTFEKNIFVTEGRPVFAGGYHCPLALRNHYSDLNVFWDVSGKPISFTDREHELSFEEWQGLGRDLHSVVGDPKFQNLDARDLSLADDSPAFALGFEPIDLSDVGPRPEDARE